MAQFAVVEFLSSKTAAVIPCTWFYGDEESKCYWPPNTWSSNKRTNAI